MTMINRDRGDNLLYCFQGQIVRFACCLCGLQIYYNKSVRHHSLFCMRHCRPVLLVKGHFSEILPICDLQNCRGDHETDFVL